MLRLMRDGWPFLSRLQCSAGRAEPAVPDGTWLVNQRVAFDVFSCQNALCGRIVWLRNPALRTSEMCGRTIIWGLTSDGPAQWDGGWFFDPENGATYNVSARVEIERSHFGTHLSRFLDVRPHRNPDADRVTQPAGLVRNRVRQLSLSARGFRPPARDRPSGRCP